MAERRDDPWVGRTNPGRPTATGGSFGAAVGASGAVDDATPGMDAVLGREVSMVVLPPASGDALARRTEQVRRLAALHHPNLVDIYDVDGLAADTESTLVLQHVEGRRLDEFAGYTGAWSPEPFARVAAQVTAGLAHAHAHGVVHGAIGGASVLVDASLQAWLTGFTDTLRPDHEVHVRAAHLMTEPFPARTPAADVAALGRTLRSVLAEGAPPALVGVLAAMVDGRATARDAVDGFVRAADSLTGSEVVTSLVALPTRYGPGPPPSVATPAPPTASPAPGPVPDAPATPAPAVPPVPVLPPRVSTRSAGRRRRGANVGRAALLGVGAVAIGLGSAVALWAVEGPSGPPVAREEPSRSTGPVDDGRTGSREAAQDAGPVSRVPATTHDPTPDAHVVPVAPTAAAARPPVPGPSTSAPPPRPVTSTPSATPSTTVTASPTTTPSPTVTPSTVTPSTRTTSTTRPTTASSSASAEPSTTAAATTIRTTPSSSGGPTGGP